jgi:hypothetical protein
VTECSGAIGALARRIISTKPVRAMPVRLMPLGYGDGAGQAAAG